MLRGFLLALVVASLPATRSQQPPPSGLTLELRIYLGATEVTSDTRVTIHKAGDRGEPFARLSGARGGLELPVPQGIYDVQAILERDGQVLNIRWANRLVVMPYPDEGGRHLEVVNFSSGFGALQVRAGGAATLDVSLYPSGRRDKVVVEPRRGNGYALFVVPAGVYDVRVGKDAGARWHTGIEVPLDRTRLWLYAEPERFPSSRLAPSS
ncbi:MAG TPA: hypothetical protein VLD67_21405 [Vicinamibacterales bacterium]|nr:hypothetical protein [Vicinamibacterales bacterium]